jgi:hypothetical protein
VLVTLSLHGNIAMMRSTPGTASLFRRPFRRFASDRYAVAQVKATELA